MSCDTLSVALEIGVLPGATDALIPRRGPDTENSTVPPTVLSREIAMRRLPAGTTTTRRGAAENVKCSRPFYGKRYRDLTGSCPAAVLSPQSSWDPAASTRRS